MNGPLSNPVGLNGQPNMGIQDEQTMAAVKAVRLPLPLASPPRLQEISLTNNASARCQQ